MCSLPNVALIIVSFIALSTIFLSFMCRHVAVCICMHFKYFLAPVFEKSFFSLIEGKESPGNIHPKIRVYYRFDVQLTWLNVALVCSHTSN